VQYVIPPEQTAQIRGQLERVGIRPTQQRIALYSLLFRHGQRHITAEQLHWEARQTNIMVSTATVYNTLNHFAETSLIRRVSVNGQRTYFDTCSGDHQHFFIEAEDRILDIPDDSLTLGSIPEPPEGYVVSKVDIVVHLERADNQPKE